MKFKDLYLPIGLVFAFIIGMLLPAPGAKCASWSSQSVTVSQIIIFSIFLLSGYQLKLEDFSFDKKLLSSLSGGIIINLCLAPLLAFALSRILPIEDALKIGLITIACVPPTMASGIISTDLAQGNKTTAIIFTIVLNIIGIFIVPFTFSHLANVGSSNLIDPIQILKTLLSLVLVPAIIGYLIKKKWGAYHHPALFYYQPTAIIFIAYCTVGKEYEKFFKLAPSTFSIVLITVIVLHMILFLICLLFGKLTKMPKKEKIALTFVCSQKTLPLALAVLSVLPAEIRSIATITCLLYHLSQVFIDSFIAVAWADKQPLNTNPS